MARYFTSFFWGRSTLPICIVGQVWLRRVNEIIVCVENVYIFFVFCFWHHRIQEICFFLRGLKRPFLLFQYAVLLWTLFHNSVMYRSLNLLLFPCLSSTKTYSTCMTLQNRTVVSTYANNAYAARTAQSVALKPWAIHFLFDYEMHQTMA
jgi:hypothetical protein